MAKQNETSNEGNGSPKIETIAENQKKWGKMIWKAGWTGVPTILLDKQHTLQLTPTEFNVLIQIMKYWWYKGNLARPSKAAIAQAMGVSQVTVRRAISRMESGGLIERISRMDHTGQRPNQYDLKKLVAALTPHAKEAVNARQKRKIEVEEIKKRKKAKES